MEHSPSLPVLPEAAPIASLLTDAGVNDILVNGVGSVYVERQGGMTLTPLRFADETAVRALAEAIANAAGRPLDPDRPLLDTRLADGSRVNIVAPPLAVDGTMISIRKFSPSQITLDMMATQGNISPQLAEFLKICGRCRINILVAGGTGSGKTTLLNALSQSIEDEERVVTIEDTAELRLMKPHVVRLETHPLTAGEDPRLEVTTRDLVRNALRMRPNRIIVGEVRGEEAFDMMQAMNTGHEGSLCTMHANHPRDALFRLENMVNLAGFHLPVRAIRGQIASALHLVVQISRMQDGLRRVTFVSEVCGMEGDVITMHDLMQFISHGERADGRMNGDWRFSGIVPRFARRIVYWGEGKRFTEVFGVKLPGV
ncbi:MAG: CpaF family protein [Alphaproteobacteria bacterium]|nr:CpaF family protein [Alphaproteobacteria bacterium]